MADQTGSNTGSMMGIHVVKEQFQMSLTSILYQQQLHFRPATGQMEGTPCRHTQTLPGPAECCQEQDRL